MKESDKDTKETSQPTSQSQETHDESQDNKPEKSLSLEEVIREQATEYDAPLSKNLTLRKILGGDILYTDAIRRQIWLVLLIAMFIIVYIASRYSCQQHLIQIDQLTNKLQDAKYKAMTSSSQLTEKSRESYVLDMMRENKDSTLHIANQPPYIINVPEK